MSNDTPLLVVFVDPDVAVHAEAERMLLAAGYDAAAVADVTEALACQKVASGTGPVLFMIHTPSYEEDCRSASLAVFERPDLRSRARVTSVMAGPTLVGQQVPLESVVKFIKSMRFERLILGPTSDA